MPCDLPIFSKYFSWTRVAMVEKTKEQRNVQGCRRMWQDVEGGRKI
jgi:hypothetical protein